MLKCDFNKVALQIEILLRQGYSPINLLHIFETHFTKNTSGRLLLKMQCNARSMLVSYHPHYEK